MKGLATVAAVAATMFSHSEDDNPIPNRYIELRMASGHRLAFLVVESEPAQGLSTRKLLLETAKYNVLTAYSLEEALRMFQRFPRVDAVAVDGSFGEEACSGLAKSVKESNPNIRVVGFVPHMGARCRWADVTTDSHDPAGLLKVLEGMGGRTDIA